MYHFVCILKCIYVNMFYYLDILKTDKINNLFRYFLDNVHLSTVPAMLIYACSREFDFSRRHNLY